MARGRPSRQTIYERLEEAIDDLRTRLGGLPNPAEAEEIWEELWHQEAHHSTALEEQHVGPQRGPQVARRGPCRRLQDSRSTWRSGVRGCGQVGIWPGAGPGGWTTGDLLSIQEVRTVHYEAMTPVWNVAPHPHATAAETPGSWRQHDIAPFPEGMTPPPVPPRSTIG